MGNTIRLSNNAPSEKCLSMSNQGTDLFFELLICSSENLQQTEAQKELMMFIKDQKEINDIAPGTAGFEIDEMPWTKATKADDISFLLKVIEKAKSRDMWEKYGLEPEESIIIPWLDTFGDMIREA